MIFIKHVKYILSIFVLLFFLISSIKGQNLFSKKKILLLMGSRFEFTALHPNQKIAEQSIDSAIAEVQRIENLISSWKPNSQTSLINDSAAFYPIKISKELFDLIYRCQKISDLTNGAFDISFASNHKIWTFEKQDVSIFPNDSIIQKSIEKINYKNIVLDSENQTIFFKKKGIKIGFGAIGKGFAANRAKTIMQKNGIKNGLVNAGGDLISWGKNHEKPWQISIADPKNAKKTLAWLEIENQAVVTSGNYEKYFTFNGKRYAHIINPKTGYPSSNLKSVTIICPDAELADALATAVFVMGENEGLELVNQLNGIECLLVNSENKIIKTNNVKINFSKN